MPDTADRGKALLTCRVVVSAFALLGAMLTSGLQAQWKAAHALYHETDVPGRIGQLKNLRGGPALGYFQGIQVRAPEGVFVSFAEGADFDSGEPAPRSAGMLVGRVYRFKLFNIPLRETESLYPTIEIIDRTYPPAGLGPRFPAVVEITEDDLRQALGGNMVAKVIYVEAPDRALPLKQPPGEQRWIDVSYSESAMQVADELGRPIAILRMGGVTPGPQGPDQQFLFCSPPLRSMDQVGAEPEGDGQFNFACDCTAGCSIPCDTHTPSCRPGGPRPFPGDEYLCDGGDEDPEVRPLTNGGLQGLDSEDTVAIYDAEQDLNVNTQVVASNRVCIYAPRFAAVRKVVGPMLTHKNDGAVGMLGNNPLRTDTALGTPVVENIRNPVVDQTARVRSNEYSGKLQDGVESRVDALLIAQEFASPYVYSTLAKTGLFEQREGLLVQRGVDNAIVWTHDLAVQVMLGETHPSEVAGDRKAQATYVFDRRGRPEVRICKMASSREAQPGDEIEFTLRFDNLSDKRAEELTIVDNLTTRLEYVEGSQECSLPAEFTKVENNGESLTLQWRLKEPLPGGEGGVILFKCVVR